MTTFQGNVRRDDSLSLSDSLGLFLFYFNFFFVNLFCCFYSLENFGSSLCKRKTEDHDSLCLPVW